MDLKIKLSTVGFNKSQRDRGLEVFLQPSSNMKEGKYENKRVD
jgi:hypothetical protein